MADDDALPSFFCPITSELMQDPVTTTDGLSYERGAIEKWFAEGKRTSPLTNNVLNSLVLTPNYSLKNALAEYRAKKDKETLQKAEEEKKKKEKEEKEKLERMRQEKEKKARELKERQERRKESPTKETFQLHIWLTKLGLENLTPKMTSEGFNHLSALLKITMEDVKDMKIRLGDGRRILDAVAQMEKKGVQSPYLTNTEAEDSTTAFSYGSAWGLPTPEPVISTTTSIQCPTTANAQSPILFQVTVRTLTNILNPSGLVELYNDIRFLEKKELGLNGVVQFERQFPVGRQLITAKYLGGSNFQASTTAVVLNIRASTKFCLTSVVLGQEVNLRAQLSSNVGEFPEGFVDFYDDKNFLQTVKLNKNGQATFTVKNLACGVHFMRAEYSGNETFLSSSDSISVTVKSSPTLAILTSSSPSPLTISTPITFSARVTKLNISRKPFSPPSGTIQFLDDGELLAELKLNQGTASTTHTFTAGAHNITCEYMGSDIYEPSQSDNLRIVVSDVKCRVCGASFNPFTPSGCQSYHPGQSTTPQVYACCRRPNGSGGCTRRGKRGG